MKLGGLDLSAFGADEHVVLFVIDGLGYNFLRRSAAPNLNQALQLNLSTVFPSTTASAITTLLTGLSPAEHGNVGWHMYEQSIDAVICPLPFIRRDTDTPLAQDNLEPAALFGYEPFANCLDADCYAVSPQSIAFSPFSRYHAGRGQICAYATLGSLFENVSQILRRARQRSFIYAYYPEIDRLGHLHGINSRPVATALAALDQKFGNFLEDCAGSGATVLLTADHGFVDPPPAKRLRLPDFPHIKCLLTQMLCGEPRVAYCHVAPASQEKFVAAVEDVFAGQLDLHSSEELISEGYFGAGPHHAKLRSRVGDFTLIMRDDYMLIDGSNNEELPTLNGVHGGLSTDEMRVPLCAVSL